MAITINSTASIAPQSSPKVEANIASLAKTSQELEGKMALNLIHSAGSTAIVSAPTAS
jgi:hypothetical protein